MTTLTIVYERERPKAHTNRPYTPEEDAAIRAKLAANQSYREIAADLGRTVSAIKYRIYAMENLRPHRGQGIRATAGPDNCRRCGLLLAHAPAGHDRMCGYCVKEIAP